MRRILSSESRAVLGSASRKMPSQAPIPLCYPPHNAPKEGSTHGNGSVELRVQTVMLSSLLRRVNATRGDN
jgi:hypothetical protein